MVGIAEEATSLLNMHDSVPLYSEQTRKDRVCRDQIIREQDRVEKFGYTVERTVAVHRDDTVSNNEMWSNRRADIENAFVDSCPVKEILGPAVAAPRDNAKHVFQAERDSGPMVGFYFRHGHDEIRCEDDSREPQVAEAGVVCLELRFDKFVAIEIHERDLAVCKLIAEAVS